MPKEYYLVDFENVGPKRLEILCRSLSRGEVVVFCPKRSCNLIKMAAKCVTNKNVTFRLVDVSVGTKNALDFQLATYLGYLIHDDSGDKVHYNIVSDDKGVDCLCCYWKAFKTVEVVVRRIPLSSLVPAPSSSAAKRAKRLNKKVKSPMKPKGQKKAEGKTSGKSHSVTLKEIRGLLSAGDDPEAVLQLLSRCNSASALNIGLERLYKDTKKTHKVYRKLKPVLKKKERCGCKERHA